jgi:NAD(P)-dependent dehydrogenase (short-subunit alcohol dehydrogenase family)
MHFSEPMLKPGALNDKIVVVTGGGTGLGKSMSQYFCELGAKVVIASRKQEVLDKTAAELSEKTGAEVLPFACDIRRYEEVEALRLASIERFGRVDILVNNAAGNFVSPTEKLSAGAFDAIIDIVLKGSKNCTLSFGKHWIDQKQKNTVVLNIVTTYAWTGSPFVVPSAMAKAGVLAMTRSLAVEWAKYGMRHNAIAPGPFPTAGAWNRLIPGDIPERLNVVNQVPLRRAGNHQELSNLAAYMISDYSAYMNGEVVTLDGGEWLQDAGQLAFLDQLTPGDWEDMERMIKAVKGSN